MQPDTPASATAARGKVVLSAFALHAGGGGILLREIVDHLAGAIRFATIDWRVADSLPGLAGAEVRVVPSRLLPRIRALISVARAAQPGDRLFCLNSLPPLVRSPGHCIVYVHSAQFAGLAGGIGYPLMVRLRLAIDRALFALGRRNIDEIWVQTQTVASAMQGVAPDVPIAIMPFVNSSMLARNEGVAAPEPGQVPAYFYPADAMAHKNHKRLFEAWQILSDRGGDAQLLVTLEDAPFRALVAAARVEPLVGTRIINKGPMPHGDVLATLRASRGLIFPSLTETFGLPLVEARAQGIAIVASERDFVRDVCEPAETFDPLSPLSIARAILRHMGQSDAPPLPTTGAAVAARLL